MMSSQGPFAGSSMAHPVPQLIPTLCSVDDDVKLLIATKLHSFDDYYNLRATNSTWRNLLGRHEYLIMKGIILYSSTHMHDLKLSRAQSLNDTFTGYQYPIADISAASRLPAVAFHTLFERPGPTDLSQRVVHAFVARWHEVKNLAYVYLRPALLSDFITTDLPYTPPTVDGSDPDSQNEQNFHLDQPPMPPSQLKAQDNFYTRFYQAASALFLLSEAIMLANTIQYANIAEYKEVRGLLGKLLDTLNIKEWFVLCEVENFLYNFLLPKTFAPYATSWSEFRDYVAGDLSDRNTFADTWKRTMKILRLSANPELIRHLLSYYQEREPLPANMSWILRSTNAFGLRESNMIGRITNVGGLRPKQRLGPMEFNAKDLGRCVSGALRRMPAYEHMSNSAVSAGWKSFVTDTGFGSWTDRVKGQLAKLDEDWEDYRLDGLHAHVMAFHQKELVTKELKKREAKAKKEAARAEIAARAGDTTEDDEAMDGEAMDDDAMDGDAMDGDAMDGDAMDGDAMDGDAMDDNTMDID